MKPNMIYDPKITGSKPEPVYAVCGNNRAQVTFKNGEVGDVDVGDLYPLPAPRKRASSKKGKR